MIVQNALICGHCDDFIFSKHRHDFVTCKCGAVSVDGGQEYLRRVGDFASAIDMSWELPDEEYKACADAAEWATESGRNKYGIANAVMRKLWELERIITDHQLSVIASNGDEIMVKDREGNYARYRKVVEDELE